MDIAVKRIIWGKCINAGQTCIAPDYILCTRQIQNTFVEKARELLKAWYTDDPKNSPDFCRIVSEKHFVYVYANYPQFHYLKNYNLSILFIGDY